MPERPPYSQSGSHEPRGRAREAAAAFEEVTLENTDDMLTRQDPGAWPNSFRKARFLSAVDHIQLGRLRRRVMQVMETIFRKVNVILTPAIAGKMTLIGNMTGHPCVTIRAGFNRGHQGNASLPGC